MSCKTETMVIARKYAKAFINVFLDTLTQEDHDNIVQAAEFLRTHKRVLFYLHLPAIEHGVKEEGIKKLVDRFSLPVAVQKLLSLLLAHNRVLLIPDVLEAVTELYKERKEILAFVINTSHELPAERITEIKQFLAHLTGKAIIYTYKVDTELIAGVRLQSATILWEYSIRKQLHTIVCSART